MRYTSTTKQWIDANVIQQVPGIRIVTVDSGGGLVDGGLVGGGHSGVLDGGVAAGGQVGAVDGGAP